MTTSATVPNTGTQSAANPLKGLLAYGQSPWMDYIRRDLLTGGGLKKYIDNDGLRGMTSNPTIFEKAINITVICTKSAYEKVAEAFIAALEARAAKGQPINHIASVASFFVSRIDSLIDSKIDALLKTASGDAKVLLESLHGTIAIANAKLTYKKYQELFGGPRWKALAAKRAQTQRLLWASTSTKNPKYRDVLYVDALIGADTGDTIPPATFDAFRDHGKLRPSLTEDVPGAARHRENLATRSLSAWAAAAFASKFCASLSANFLATQSFTSSIPTIMPR